jgi:hypothetical protein
MRRLMALGSTLALSGLGLIPMALTGSSAFAASDYSGAQYQVEFSLNCTDPSALCYTQHGLGGIWGWMALMPDHIGNAQVAVCSHAYSGSGPGGAGAVHASFDPRWGTTFIPLSIAETSLPAIDPSNTYIVLDPTTEPAGVHVPPFPATPGHYALNPALGANGSITIAPPSGV